MVKIFGLVGKYDLQDAYKSIRESLSHAGTYNDHKVKITFINSEYLTEENVAEQLKGQDGIVICPGFGQRGIEGKIIAAHYTRTHDIPTFGICLGMQMMVIEFARNVLGYKDANSREMDEKDSSPQRYRHHGGAEEHIKHGWNHASRRLRVCAETGFTRVQYLQEGAYSGTPSPPL